MLTETGLDTDIKMITSESSVASVTVGVMMCSGEDNCNSPPSNDKAQSSLDTGKAYTSDMNVMHSEDYNNTWGAGGDLTMEMQVRFLRIRLRFGRHRAA